MNPTINQEVALLRDFLDRENEIGILIGSHQNVDTYAAALALYLSLTQSGKKVQIISKKAPTVEVSNLVGIDRVKESFQGSTSKLVVALPYIKGEVEKVLFTEAPDTINFHLTAAPGKSITSFELSDVKLMWEGGAPSSLITIGVGTTDEVALVTDPNTTKIVNIDNYQGNTRFGDVVMVDETFSSLSEIIGKAIKDLSLPIDVDIAQNLMDGVMYATRGFTKSNTSPVAFETVSTAMYHGAQRKSEEPRRDQGYSGQPRQQMPQPDRAREQRRPQNQPQRQPRVNDNDFPAMHMQGGGQRPPMQDQARDNRRGNQGNQGRTIPPQQRQAGRQQMGQNSRDIEELLRKINEENARRQGGGQQQYGQNRPQGRPQNMPQETRDDRMNMQDQPLQDEEYAANSPIQDAQIVEPPMSAPTDTAMPQDQPYTAPNDEDVPDDWLMPKVFKSSKNNN